MSDNKPNWADKANVALNVVQVVQIHQVHSALQALAALEAERSQREFDGHQAKEREDRLRDFIWRLEDAFESYVRKPDTTPCGRLIVAKQMVAALKKVNVTTAAFSQFGDKDRMGQFLRRLDQTIEDSTRALPSGQITDALIYVRYEAEARDLDALIQKERDNCRMIEIKTAKAEKRRVRASRKLEELRAQATAPKTEDKDNSSCWRKAMGVAKSVTAVSLILFACVSGLVGVLSVGVFLYYFFQASPGSNGVFLGVGVGLLVFAGVLVGLAGGLLPKSLKGKPLQDRIKDAEREVAAAEKVIAELTHEHRPDWELHKYNAHDLFGLMRERDRRMAFMLQFTQANNL